MVVFHRAHGFRFVIYTADHDPRMFTSHEQGRRKSTCWDLRGDPEIVSSVGIKRSDLRRLVTEVRERRYHFLQEWERIHGQSD